MDAYEIVDQMVLEPGHVLTDEECDAIGVVARAADDFRAIKRRLGIEDE